MLLNEFLKGHRKVEELEATVTQLQAAFKTQAAQIQKVRCASWPQRIRPLADLERENLHRNSSSITSRAEVEPRITRIARMESTE